MRASEFTNTAVTESNHMDADQVLQYVKKTHAPEEFNIEYSITDHPAWELKNIPVSQLNLDPDGETPDPYNRTNWVDYDVVRDLMPKIVQVLKSKPIVVDSDGWIIDGNHRAMAAAEAGLTSVPALVPVEVKEDVTESREEFEGMTIEMEKPFDGKLIIRALDDWGNNILGFVVFNIGDNNELDPQDLSVDTRYQGQGIARAMYDYVKSKGYKIHRSWDQTDAGAGFWNKHRGEDVRVWEQGMAEGSDRIAANKQDRLDALENKLIAKGYIRTKDPDRREYQYKWTKDGAPTYVVNYRFGSNGYAEFWKEQGMAENFADGKGPGRPGDSQRHGIPKHATMAELEKASHADGRKGQLARWQLNMRRGHKK